MSRNGRPPRQERGFVRVTHLRCPACEDREALRNDGGRKVTGGGQLKGSTKDVGLTTAAAGCELCEGTGAISTNDARAMLAAGYEMSDRVDPYARDVRAALERRGAL